MSPRPASNSALVAAFDALPAGQWRIVPSPDGMSLEYREPARLQWVSLYDGLSVAGCLRAYSQLQDGERPSLETCEVDV